MNLADPLDPDTATPRVPPPEPLPRLDSLKAFGLGLSRQLAECRRRGGQLALLWLELEARDATGACTAGAAAEGLMRIAGQRLRNRVRGVDPVVRIGDQGFAVLLTATGTSEAGLVERRLLHALQGAYGLDGRQWRLGVRIGSAVFPEAGRDGIELAEAARRQLQSRATGGAVAADGQTSSHSLRM